MDYGRWMSLTSVRKPSELVAHEIAEAVSEPPESSASATSSESGSDIVSRLIEHSMAFALAEFKETATGDATEKSS